MRKEHLGPACELRFSKCRLSVALPISPVLWRANLSLTALSEE